MLQDFICKPKHGSEISPINFKKKMDLRNFDFKIAVDKSGSMSGKRWKRAHEISKAIVAVCEQYDSDGIDLYVFDSKVTEFKNTTSGKVDEIFRTVTPSGGTMMAPVFEAALPKYFQKKGFLSGIFQKKEDETKPVILIIFTDGEPYDRTETMNSIISITKQIQSREEVGISILQVGDDRDATKFLEFLDDNLVKNGAKFDIVDTKTYEVAQGMGAEEIITNALTD